MALGKRLKAIIKEEGLSQRAFAKKMDLSVTAIEHYIAERRTPSGDLFIAMGMSEQFRKYTMWLLTGEVEANSGQVCPSFSTLEQCGLVGDDSPQKRA